MDIAARNKWLSYFQSGGKIPRCKECDGYAGYQCFMTHGHRIQCMECGKATRFFPSLRLLNDSVAVSVLEDWDNGIIADSDFPPNIAGFLMHGAGI
jgi:hypothetical protein